MDNDTKQTFHTTAKKALEAVREYCRPNSMTESCGFIGWSEEKKSFVVHRARNCTNNPRYYYAVDPYEFFSFRQEYQLVVIFHSHTYSDETPSELDIIHAEACCLAFLIYSLQTEKMSLYQPKHRQYDVTLTEKLKKHL